MKIYILSISLCTLFFLAACKTDASKKIKEENVQLAAQRDELSKNLPIMTFEKKEHDFGTIAWGTPVETIFKFTNTGNAPLVITNATSSCGCTIPEYPKDKSIAPGQSGELKVKFNGSGKNLVTKIVTVYANTEKGNEQLKIKAFVETKEAQGKEK